MVWQPKNFNFMLNVLQVANTTGLPPEVLFLLRFVVEGTSWGKLRQQQAS
jgi:hypothetical protein